MTDSFYRHDDESPLQPGHSDGMTVATDVLESAQQATQRACARTGVTVLELRTPAEAYRAADLFQQVWRSAEPIVPGNLVRTVQHIGGYVFGAYDESGTMVAATFAMLSDEGLHSHLTGVVPGAERRGLGFALKQHQRWWAIERGIERITWTCDPLVRRNVGFNLHALGAEVAAYLPDHYGAMRDGVNGGDESDRFELHWELTSDRAVEAAEHRLPWVTGGRTVDLPEDIEVLRMKDPGQARTWRHTVREALVPALAAGERIAGMTAEGALVLA
jgi:predicted GNAT superfamily acetyltransferase